MDFIGLREDARPVFRSRTDGHWRYTGDVALLHLTIARGGGASAPSPGAFNQLAFGCEDMDSSRACFDTACIAYQTDIVGALRVAQLFLSYPAGIGVELTCAHPA